MTTDVMVIAPHPDDEVLGCGGSIAVHHRACRNVQVVYLTSGEAGSLQGSPDGVADKREAEARAAAETLGVASDNAIFLRFPDGEIAPTATEQLAAVVGLLRRSRPGLLYMPHSGDGSFDHRAAFELCWRAAGLAAGATYPQWGERPYWVPTVLGYEVWSPVAEPQYGEDITAVLEHKLAALDCYRSQTATAHSDKQADYVGPAAACLSRYRGAMSTGGHRECFQVLRLGQVMWS